MKCLEFKKKNQLALCYSVTHGDLSVGITPKTYIEELICIIQAQSLTVKSTLHSSIPLNQCTSGQVQGSNA